NFMNSFKDILENNKFQLSFVDKEKQYRIYLSGKNNVNKFSRCIYKDKGLHLKRKYNIFQEKE
ncbi:endonuclease, partial [Bacillus cereus]|nr:endonuclease [Bacillus cereus]